MKEEEWIQFQQQKPGQFGDFVSCYRKDLSGSLKKRTLKEIGQVLAESLSAMANADGGTVFLGVEMDGEVSGFFFDDRVRRLFLRSLERSSLPPLRFGVTRVEMEEKPCSNSPLYPVRSFIF